MTAPTTNRPEPEARTYAAYSRPLWQRALFLTREFAVIALLVAVFFYSSGNVDNFDSPLTLYYLFLDVAPILLIALPMTMIIITGEIDLSVASVVGLSSVLVGHAASGRRLVDPRRRRWSRSSIGAVAGAFNGFLVAYVGLPSSAVTIGTLALYRGIAVGPARHHRRHRLPRATGPTWPSSGSRTGRAYPLILIPFVVLLAGFALLLALLAVRPWGLRDRSQRRGGPLHRCRRRPHQVPGSS